MSSYILRDIPDRIWQPVKARAVRDRVGLRAVFLHLLRGYGEGRLTAPPSLPPLEPRGSPQNKLRSRLQKETSAAEEVSMESDDPAHPGRQ